MMLAVEEAVSSKDRNDQGRGPEDGDTADTSRDGSNDSSTKRKYCDREPESPGHKDPDPSYTPYAKKERTFYDATMDADSPSSYPKHVLVPDSEPQNGDEKQISPEGYTQQTKPSEAPVLTPDSMGRGVSGHGDVPLYPRHQPYQHSDTFSAPPFTPEMDHGPAYEPPHGNPGGNDPFARPRRWACDYCNVATFLSYEEACAHEDACARRQQEARYYANDNRQPPPPHPPTATYGGDSRGDSVGPPMQPHGSGLGALYHASQEVVTPPTPHSHHSHRQPHNQWGNSRGPPIPVLPHDQGYYRQGYYDMREDPARYHRHDPYQPHPHNPHQAPYQHQPHYQQPYQKRMLLAMQTDPDSLSDRQCYVRSEMVEIFAATEKEVAARHSKGAQKLQLGQVGIRCVYCSHLRARDRAERAVCYPSSISRIYQTVADMQRFHFEQCREIPDHVRQVYKGLKTTRPRGVGSPQTYWIQSAKGLGLIDTEGGIRFDTDFTKRSQTSDMSV